MTSIATSFAQPTSASPALSAVAAAAVRCALQAPPRRSAADDEVRRVLRLLCDAAQSRGLQAEALIVILKEAWASLPEQSAGGRDYRRNEIRARLVTLLIDEFYRTRDTAASA